MTAAGLALMAGGIATLVSFRAVLFGGGERRERETGGSRRRAALRTRRGAARAGAVVPAGVSEGAVAVAGPVAPADLATSAAVVSHVVAGPAGVAASVDLAASAAAVVPHAVAGPAGVAASVDVAGSDGILSSVGVAGAGAGRRARRRAIPPNLETSRDFSRERSGRRRSRRHLSEEEEGGLASIGLADYEDDLDAAADMHPFIEGGETAVDPEVLTGLSETPVPEELADLAADAGAGAEPDFLADPDVEVTFPAGPDAELDFMAEPDAEVDFLADADADTDVDAAAKPAQARHGDPSDHHYVDRSDRRYGDRVEGWVRPEYRNLAEEPKPGEYWTPIPVDLDDPEPSAKGYGWPAPVERLPAAPPYQPPTRFDLLPPSEPTEVVPAWPNGGEKGRIRLPRSWATRNEKPEPPEGRRRPRPRPRPGPDDGVDRSTVYVSRHAAEPPR